MDSVVNMALEQLMAGDNLSLISSKVGADEQSTKSALEMGLPLLLGAMSSKASSKDGANTILSGLSDSAKGNSMQDMAKYLGSSSSSFGPGMLNSILGSSMIPIQQSIAKKTGLASGGRRPAANYGSAFSPGILDKKLLRKGDETG